MLPQASRLTRAIRASLIAAALAVGAVGSSHAFATPTGGLADLEPFVDGVVAQQLRARVAPGAVVVVVKNGQILLAKGYGQASVAGRRRPDPDTTMFRIASVSKLFVGVAVMQLVERGRLRLNDDAGRWLGLEFDYPFTVKDLLTHRAGFENSFTGIFTDPSRPAPSLQQVIDAGLPRQVFRPGTVPAYSNHGFVLLGRIVEKASGLDYASYLERNVFGPLGLRYASIRQPLPTTMRRTVAAGHDLAGDRWIEQPFEIVAASPGGGVSISGVDIARFAAALMADDPVILRPGARDRLTSPLARVAPGVAEVGAGFMLQRLNGRRAWYHTGGIDYAFSRLTALPDEQLAIFVAYNGNGAGEAHSDLVDAVLDRYFPAPPPAPTRRSARDLERYAGAYQTSGSYFGSFAALGAASQQALVAPDGNGLLLNEGGRATRWRLIGGDRFAQTTGVDRGSAGDLVFIFQAGGERPVAFARVNSASRVALRREGARTWNVAKSMLIGLGICSALLGLLAVVRLWRVRRRPIDVAVAAAMVAGAALLPWFCARYVSLFGRLTVGLELDGYTRSTLAMPAVAIMLLAAAGIFGLWRARGRAERLDWSTAAGSCALAVAVGAFASVWGLWPI